MKEFIYRIEDNESDESEVFIGWIRKQGHELIRCKDCMHYKDNECTNTFWGMCESGYCSEGKRKEE